MVNSQKELMDQLSGLITSKVSTFEARFSENQRELSDNQLSKIQQNILRTKIISSKKKKKEL